MKVGKRIEKVYNGVAFASIRITYDTTPSMGKYEFTEAYNIIINISSYYSRARTIIINNNNNNNNNNTVVGRPTSERGGGIL